MSGSPGSSSAGTQGGRTPRNDNAELVERHDDQRLVDSHALVGEELERDADCLDRLQQRVVHSGQRVGERLA